MQRWALRENAGTEPFVLCVAGAWHRSPRVVDTPLTLVREEKERLG